MGISGIVVRYVVIGCALLLSACGGGGDGGDSGSGANTPAPPPPTSGIGPAGGTVNGPNGSKVVIPPGALAAATPIAITQIACERDAAACRNSVVRYDIRLHAARHDVRGASHGDAAARSCAIPAGVVPQMLKTNAQNQWQEIPNAVFGTTTMSGEVTSFSDFVGGLQRNTPVRDWEFFKRLGVNSSTLIQLDPPNHGGIQPGDVDAGEAVSDIVEFGPALFDEPVVDLSETRLPDSIANGQAFGSASGVSYSVFAEAPDALVPGRRADRQPHEAQADAELHRARRQSRRCARRSRRSGSSRRISTGRQGPCRRNRLDQRRSPVRVAGLQEAGDDPFFYTAGRASVSAPTGDFDPRADDESFSRVHLWDLRTISLSGPVPPDFPSSMERRRSATSTSVRGRATARARSRCSSSKRRSRSISRSRVSTSAMSSRCEPTRSPTSTTAGAEGRCSIAKPRRSVRSCATLGDRRRASGSSRAWSRPTVREDPPADPRRLEPEACEPGPGPDPAAGELQFEAATFTVGELDNAVPQVAVTRTGGSRGAVTATFTTSDGTATAGTDYTALNTTVFFGDGEEGRRIVPIPITADAAAELDETVNLSLSEPGGCAALGSRTAAVMKIFDDRSALTTQPSGLDPTFDTDGKVTTQFGGDDTGMAIQPDGKIVMVGGSISDFVLARYNTNGSLDTTFGTNGLVTHSLLGGSSEEIARAVAIQPDGKIVVAGHTGQFGRPGRPAGNRFDHAIVRFNANGSVDTTFGTGGVASAFDRSHLRDGVAAGRQDHRGRRCAAARGHDGCALQPQRQSRSHVRRRRIQAVRPEPSRCGARGERGRAVERRDRLLGTAHQTR